MKLNKNLLSTIALSITVSVASTSCHKNDVNSGTKHKNKEEKEIKSPRPERNPDYCPACGMG